MRGDAYFHRRIEHEPRPELRQRYYEQAVDDFDHAIRLDPFCADAYHERSSALITLQQYEQALADINMAIQLDSTDARFFWRRAFICWHSFSDFDGGEMDYAEATRLEPEYFWAHSDWGEMCMKLRAHERAIAHFTDALNLRPLAMLARSNRAYCYNRLDQFELALADRLQNIENGYDDPFAYYSLGNAYSNLKDYPQALISYDECLGRDPRFHEAYCNRADVYETLGDYEKALADINEAIRLEPDDPDYYESRASIYRRLGRDADATEDAQKAKSLPRIDDD